MKQAMMAAMAAALILAGGRAAAQQAFNLDETVAVCAGCHGEDGHPISGDIPILWGQQFYYLYVQLKDFKAGRRANDVMQPIAEQFDKDQMKALATYFAGKKWPNVQAPAGEFVGANLVQRLIVDGQCTGCHNTFMGDSRLPRVAGQQFDYLKRALLELRNNTRKNAAAMTALMNAYQESDLEILARYLSAL